MLYTFPGRHSRNRRDISNDDEHWTSFMEQFTTFIETKSNKTIYREVNRILKHFTSNFPVEEICKDLIKCGKGNTVLVLSVLNKTFPDCRFTTRAEAK